MTTDDVMRLISGIPDPEIPVITIKDLGILRGVELENDHYLITITPTYTACPRHENDRRSGERTAE